MKIIKRRSLWSVLLVVVIVCSPISTIAAASPNVLVILVDDMGFSDLGCYGGEARTPNLDALAAGGLRFRDFHNTARCSPTRASLLTGLYSHQAATDPSASLPTMRNDNNVTIAEVLRTRGYRTYMAGKWHLGGTTGLYPGDRGFQHVFRPANANAGTVSYWSASSWTFSSSGNEIPTRNYGSGAYDFYSTDVIGDYALDFLSHHFGKGDTNSFFMYLAFNAPHFYLQVDKALAETAPAGATNYLSTYTQGWDVVRSNRYNRMRSSGVIDAAHFPLTPKDDSIYNGSPEALPIPDWNTLASDRKADLARRMALYTAMIDKVDQNIGRVITNLQSHGAFTNTLIVFMSDNGSCAEGGGFGASSPLTGSALTNMGQPNQNDNLKLGGGWANVGNTPFRYFKAISHEGGIRTPLIAHWPAGITNPGRWSDQVGHVMDIMATVVDVTGATYPAQYNSHAVLPLEGISLAPAFRNQATVSRQIGFEHESTRALIDGQWKFVTKNFDSSDGLRPADMLELYNRSVDPVELTNVAASQPAVLQAMLDEWNAWAIRVGVPGSRLIPPTVQASWDGGMAGNPGWAQGSNWVGDVVPTFGSNLDVSFHELGAANLTNRIGEYRTMRSLSFNDNADSAINIALESSSGNARTITFDTDAVGGSAQINVSSGAGGSVLIGSTGVGSIVLADPLLVTHFGSGILTVGRPITGDFSLTKSGDGEMALSSSNTFGGGIVINDGKLALSSADSENNVPDIEVDAAGTLSIGNAFVGDVASVGNLTGSGRVDPQFGSLVGTRTLSVNQTANGTFSGLLTDATSGAARVLALTKTGSADLTLAGNNTYTGPTTVSAGTLLVNGSLGNSAVTVSSGGTLGGSGVIRGTVSVQTGGTLAPGNSIGTLTISNSLTLGGTTFVEVNASNGQRDFVQGVGNITYGGALVVTNLSVTLTNSQTFQLFSATGTKSGNFASITPALTGGKAWSFNPTNGVLSVVSVTATYPTNITLSRTAGDLNLNWPGSHLGWIAQSNAVSVASSDGWFDIPGSSSATNLSITPSPARTNVFYRLHSP
jgi:arylsulfatase